MAVEMFLKIDGMTGGSNNYNHKGWADLLSWSWDLDREPDNRQASTKDARHMNEISLVKAVGTDSTELMKLFAAGKPIKKVEIKVAPVVGKRDAQQKYIGITLEDVVIKSINAGGSIEESVFKERITLHFGKIKYEYHHYGDVAATGGAATSTNYAFGWDLVADTAC